MDAEKWTAVADAVSVVFTIVATVLPSIYLLAVPARFAPREFESVKF